MTRKEAIIDLNALKFILDNDQYTDEIEEALDTAIFALQQPERKKGKWIYDGDCYICDQCKSAFGWWADSQTSNYCPNCGADMREGDVDGQR